MKTATATNSENGSSSTITLWDLLSGDLESRASEIRSIRRPKFLLCGMICQHSVP